MKYLDWKRDIFNKLLNKKIQFRSERVYQSYNDKNITNTGNDAVPEIYEDNLANLESTVTDSQPEQLINEIVSESVIPVIAGTYYEPVSVEVFDDFSHSGIETVEHPDQGELYDPNQEAVMLEATQQLYDNSTGSTNETQPDHIQIQNAVEQLQQHTNSDFQPQLGDPFDQNPFQQVDALAEPPNKMPGGQ